MATQPPTLITADQFCQLPQEEGREFELLDGEVIEMSSPTPRHNVIGWTLGSLLYPALRGRGGVIPETDFSDGRLTTLRPDLAILLGEKYSGLDFRQAPCDHRAGHRDRSHFAFRKVHFGSEERRINAYLRFGVQEVWIIYPQDRHLYVHSEAGVSRLRSGETLASPLLPEWSINVDQLFER